MKRVLLVTHMYSNNSGDLLIAESIVEDAMRRDGWSVERLPFLYYNGMGGSKWLNGLLGLRRVYRSVGNADLVIIAGGNLVIPRVLRFAGSFFVYSLIARLLKRNIYAAFMGASSRSSFIGGKLYAWSLRRTTRNWARDRHSARVIDEIAGRKDTLLSPDGAFFCQRRCPGDTTTGKRLAIVPFAHDELFWNERLTSISRENYESQYQTLVSNLKSSGWDIRILVTSEADRLMGESLAEMHDLPLFQPDDGQALFDTICEQCDFLVSTRMHGLITALLCGKGVIPVGGQHKISALFEMMAPGEETPVLSIDEQLRERLEERVQQGQWFHLEDKVRARLQEELHAVWECIDSEVVEQAE